MSDSAADLTDDDVMHHFELLQQQDDAGIVQSSLISLCDLHPQTDYSLCALTFLICHACAQRRNID